MDRHQVISLSSRLGKPPLQKLVERFQVFQSPVLASSDFAEVTPQLDEAGIPIRLVSPLPSQDLVDLGQNEQRLETTGRASGGWKT